MFGLFVMTAITLFWGGSEYEACKEINLDPGQCVEKVWSEKEPLDYSKLND